MKRFACALILCAALGFAEQSNTDAPIGQEQVTGDLKLLTVASVNEYTVFVRSNSCDTAAVAVHVVFADNTPGVPQALTKIARFRGCGLTTARLTFATDGRPVREVRAEELGNRAAHTIYPSGR